MSNIVIQVENLSKQYRLGEVGTGTLSHDLKRWWYRARGKEDPYLKIGEVNDRTIQSDNDYVWALKDINFEVKQGEVLGIIGRNGAGKSTLLKILSKTTAPTTGQIKIKGRIASLLEVGTGFHPEMTGRENIFLNGAILGMTKKEIKRKFDEIVDFAGVERYIDTPVKRYSSGMYVRLAFAVAAHLEPEILIVDEVLAVGDAEFQKKCLGKMKDVSVNEGRTVLFVSHNMGAIQKLCNVSLMLSNGSLAEIGITDGIIKRYINSSGYQLPVYKYNIKNRDNEIAYVTKLLVENASGEIKNEIPLFEAWKVKFFFRVNKKVENLVVGLGIIDSFENAIRTSWQPAKNYDAGLYMASFLEDEIFLSSGSYRLVTGISQGSHNIEYLDKNMWFKISDAGSSYAENIVNTSNGILINQMKMNVEKIIV